MAAVLSPMSDVVALISVVMPAIVADVCYIAAVAIVADAIAPRALLT
jgi:hypothetical protein